MKHILIALFLIIVLLGCGSKRLPPAPAKLADPISNDEFTLGGTPAPSTTPKPTPYGETRYFGAISILESWTDAQVGHFTNSGYEDLVFRITDGTAKGQIWAMESNGTAFEGKLLAAVSALANWKHQLVLDFNGDGYSDLALWDSGSGIWWVGINNHLNHLVFQNVGSFSAAVDWKYVRAVDYDGDGKDDILGVEPSTRNIYLGTSNGTAISNVLLGSIPSDFGLPTEESQFQVGRVDQDAFADISMLDPVTGILEVSKLVNGTLSFSSNTVFSMLVPWQFFSGHFFSPGNVSMGGYSSSNGGLIVPVSGDGAAIGGTFSNSLTWMHFLTGRFSGGTLDDVAAISKENGQWWLGIIREGQFRNQLFGAWTPPQTHAWKNILKGRFRDVGRDSIVGMSPVDNTFYVLTKN